MNVRTISTGRKAEPMPDEKNKPNSGVQMALNINDDGTITISEDTITTSMVRDKAIITDVVLEEMKSLSAKERLEYFNRLYEEFYRKNIEYTLFFGKANRPNYIKETWGFLQSLTESDFKKCHISLSKFDKLQQLIINPLTDPNHDDVIFIATEVLTEPELAELYYLKNPRSDLLAELPKAFDIPFGPYMFLLGEAIGHAATKRGFRYDLTPSGKKKSDRTKREEVKAVKGGFEVTQYKKGSENTITILNESIIQSTSAMKLFVFLLGKASQQNFNPVIYFSLQELVNNGMYSNITNARAGFKNHIMAVQSIQIAGEMKKGKRAIKQAGRVLFTGYDIDQNGVKVQVNDDFDLEYLASYYAKFPAWAFALNNNAFEILLYAFLKARVERSNVINISLSIIRERLTLPTKQEYIDKGKKWKPGQYVKQPIIDAINIISAAIEHNNDEHIKLETHYIVNDKDLDEWLKGYITITLTGDYSEKLQEIRAKQSRIIEANKARKEAAQAMVEAQKKAEKK